MTHNGNDVIAPAITFCSFPCSKAALPSPSLSLLQGAVVVVVGVLVSKVKKSKM